MKKKFYRIITVILTICLTAIMLKKASSVLFYRQPDRTAYPPYSFYYDEKEYDVLFIGSSHVMDSMQPMNLWHNHGITSYNLGAPGSRIPSSYYILKNALQYHNPKFVLIDTFLASQDIKVSPYAHQLHTSFDAIPLSAEKVRGVKDLFPDFNMRIEFLFPYIIYHNRWREMSFEKCLDNFFTHKTYEFDESLYAKGQDFLVTSIYTAPIYPQTDSPLPNNTVGLDYIRASIELCKKKRILPILVTVPCPSTGIEENSITILSKELETPYYNLNLMGITDQEVDFHNDNHLNISGGRKVTDYIGKLLVETYGLADHRGDPTYASWDDDWEVYKQKINSILRDKQDLNSSLMLCNNSIYTARIFIKDRIKLIQYPVTQKLVSQLGDTMHTEIAPETQPHDIHLEVYDAETGSLIAAKNWDFQTYHYNQFVYTQ